MTDYYQVQTTFDKREDAENTAGSLVSQRLAACAQIIGPIESFYWWEGRVERDSEWLLLVKTTCAAFDKLRKALQRLHPYDVPEIIAVPIVDGQSEYLSWLGSEVRG